MVKVPLPYLRANQGCRQFTNQQKQADNTVDQIQHLHCRVHASLQPCYAAV